MKQNITLCIYSFFRNTEVPASYCLVCSFPGNTACTPNMCNLQTPVSPLNLYSIPSKSGAALHGHSASRYQLLLIGNRCGPSLSEWECSGVSVRSDEIRPPDCIPCGNQIALYTHKGPESKYCHVPIFQIRMAKRVAILIYREQNLGFCFVVY